MPSFSKITEILQQVITEANQIALKYFKDQTDLDIKTKQHRTDIVTKVDIEVQNLIQNSILREMTKAGFAESEIGFLGEEGLVKPGKYIFLIDPIDGTKNFVSRFDIFGIAVCVFVDKQPLAGVISAPAYQKIYMLKKNKGAWLRHKDELIQLQTKSCDLSNAVVNFDINSNIPEMKGVRESMISVLSPLVRTIRMVGSSTLETCWVVENIFNFAIFGRQKAWDIAAGKLILEEANGVMVDWSGMNFDVDPFDHDRRYFAVAANKQSVHQILPYLDIASLNNILD